MTIDQMTILTMRVRSTTRSSVPRRRPGCRERRGSPDWRRTVHDAKWHSEFYSVLRKPDWRQMFSILTGDEYPRKRDGRVRPTMTRNICEC